MEEQYDHRTVNISITLPFSFYTKVEKRRPQYTSRSRYMFELMETALRNLELNDRHEAAKALESIGQ